MRDRLLVLVLAVTVGVYLTYAFMAPYTLANAPPIPNEVKTQSGTTLFTGDDVVQGKYLFQKYGLMDYGSVEGMGGYFGVDFTAYTLQIAADSIAQSYGIPVTANVTTVPQVAEAMKPTYDRQANIIYVSDRFGAGINASAGYYSTYFGANASEVRLKPDLITNQTQVNQLTSFFAWSGLISLLGYTNGFPYVPGILQPTSNVTLASALQTAVILIAIMPAAAYMFIKLLQYWNEPKAPIPLPPATPAQKTALAGMVLAAVAVGVQGLLGSYAMHLYTDTTLYGFDLSSFLPFNVARALHYTLGVLWIVVTWVAFALFVLPYFGVALSKRKTLGILGLTLFVGAGALLGIWLSYLQYIPAPWWFIFGAQGRDVAVMGTFWLISIGGVLSYLSYLFARAHSRAAEPLKPFAGILAIALGGTATGSFIGALPVVQPFANFSFDEFFRWTFIHSYVEGFWPVIVVTIVATLLVVTGLFPVKLAVAIVGADAALETVAGMLGTAHHFYWGGEPLAWMYIGSVASILEAIPLGFLLVYSLLLLRRSQVQNQLQRTTVVFVAVAGVGGGLGAVGLGAGLVNLPYVNYFLHDLQTTMAHAHASFPLAYGIPSMLMWVVAFFLVGRYSARDLRLAAAGAVIAAVGFYVQVGVTLIPLGAEQLGSVLNNGLWFAKSLYTPLGGAGFWLQPFVQSIVWLRMIGDLVAAVGLGIVALSVIYRGLVRPKPPLQ